MPLSRRGSRPLTASPPRPTRRLRLVVHDYSGHPGQIHLSRELARRGHHVEHQYCASYTTGRGATERRDGDPDSFAVRAIELGSEFARYSPIARLRQELQYARMSARAILAARPDVAVLSNIPLLSMFILTMSLRLRRVPYVFWHQDIYSEAIRVIARDRFGHLGRLIGWVAGRVERRVARGAAAIVPISDNFIDQLDAWGVRNSKVHVVPNWAAIDEMPSRPRDNAWAQAHGLVDAPVVMYAGTLGLKHDPSVISTACPVSAYRQPHRRCVRRQGPRVAGVGSRRRSRVDSARLPAVRAAAGHARERGCAARRTGKQRQSLLGAVQGPQLSRAPAAPCWRCYRRTTPLLTWSKRRRRGSWWPPAMPRRHQPR